MREETTPRGLSPPCDSSFVWGPPVESPLSIVRCPRVESLRLRGGPLSGVPNAGRDRVVRSIPRVGEKDGDARGRRVGDGGASPVQWSPVPRGPGRGQGVRRPLLHVGDVQGHERALRCRSKSCCERSQRSQETGTLRGTLKRDDHPEVGSQTRDELLKPLSMGTPGETQRPFCALLLPRRRPAATTFGTS